MIPDGNAVRLQNLTEVDTLDLNLKLLAHNGYNYLARFGANGKPFLQARTTRIAVNRFPKFQVLSGN